VISFSSSLTYYLFSEPADMRKGYYGLGNLVRQHYFREPTDGSVYIFINRRRDKMKLLIWDRTGYVIYYKALEQGTFELPQRVNNELKWEELVMILEGVKLDSVKRKKRYSYPQKRA
jgi:transposase